jgi:putative spermidine/putrescine transport system ATP-binding protein
VTPHLAVRQITKTYGGFTAVDHVDLDVAEGEFLTFLGPSGSGKSTLLYMIAGIQNASSGGIFVDGESLLDVAPHKRNIGMVFQRYTLFPTMTIDENIAFPLRIRGWSSDAVEKRVGEMMDLVRLSAFRGRMPHQLSGGQQQRVALARALAYRPRMLLMDEPLAALDKKLKEEIQVELRRIHHATGVTILYVTHDQEEAIRLADRIAVFNNGHIEQVAKPEELYERPATRFVAGFVGNSNFLRATMESAKGGKATVRFADGTRLAGLRMGDTLSSGDAVEVLLRPERLIFAAKDQVANVGLIVDIVDITYLGELFDVTAQTSWGDVVSARVSKSIAVAAKLNIGEQALLSWEDQNPIAFAVAAAAKS